MSDQTVSTTTITLDPKAIDWQALRSQGYFVKYTIPSAEKMKWDYLHNWYLTTSKYPYFLNTGARALYVKYPSEAEAADLDYDGQRWQPSRMDIEDPNLFHALVKLLMSDFFQQREVFVSNGDFYLLVYKTVGDNAKVLKIELAQQWREGQLYTFALEDSATTLVKINSLRDPSMHRSYYTIDYQRGLPILRRISPKKLTGQHIELGVFAQLKKKRYKTSIRYLDMGSAAAIKKSRLYPIAKFITDLLTYFNEIGLPFSSQLLSYQRVSRMNPEQFRKPQIDLRTKTVYVLDDRIRPAIRPNLEPPSFADDLVNRVTSMIDQNWTPQLVRKDISALHAGDLVLRLQDNTADDFIIDKEIDSTGAVIEMNAAVLRSYDDPYRTYREAHPDTITQSLNINMLTDSDDETFDDIDDEGTDGAAFPRVPEEPLRQQGEAAPCALDTYMSYRLPARNAAFQASLLNCFYQLHLKHVVRNPQNAVAELDALALMGDNIFLYADSLVYLNKDSLMFLPTPNNEVAVELIRQQTGWDMMEDIILPAIERKAYKPSDTLKPQDIELVLRNGRFVISRDYVWQIEDSPTRVMYPIPEIRRRLLALEEEHPKDVFRPSYSDAELAIFTREQLQAFDDYLDSHLGDYVSFKVLTSHDHGSAGFYPLLGLTNSTKFKAYMKCKGFIFESPRGRDTIVAYTGISYMPETQQYYVGDKYGMDERHRQDKGFVLRKIVVHRTRPNSLPLLEQLRASLFPLLEVNFVRYNQYTVYPFPFKLIDIWKETVARTQAR